MAEYAPLRSPSLIYEGGNIKNIKLISYIHLWKLFKYQFRQIIKCDKFIFFLLIKYYDV